VQIVENRIEDLEIDLGPGKKGAHFTELILDDLHNCPQGKTISKIKEHLAGIYRVFEDVPLVVEIVGDSWG